MNHNTSNEIAMVEEATNAEGVAASELEASQTPAPTVTPDAATTGFLPTQMSEPDRFKNFQTQLVKLGECLSIAVDPLDEGEELNAGTLTEAIQKELGEVVLQEEEWQAIR